jgi:hypothetical protein
MPTSAEIRSVTRIRVGCIETGSRSLIFGELFALFGTSLEFDVIKYAGRRKHD